MTTSHVPAPSSEPFTVERRRISPAAIGLFVVLLVVFVAGLFLLGAGASWGDGEGNAWVFAAGLVVTIAPFWAGMTFHKH